MLAPNDLSRRFSGGLTYHEYLAHMQQNQGLISAITPMIQLSPEDVGYFRELSGPIRVLVVSEDWCPDCALNVPVLMRIAGTNSAIEVRFVGRDENMDLLEFAKKGERKAIPTFFFFDEKWNEIGHWIERPARADSLLRDWDRSHAAPAEPDRSAEVWREYRRERSEFRDRLFLRDGLWRETVEELRHVLAGMGVGDVADVQSQVAAG